MLEYEKVQLKSQVKEILTNLRFLSNGLLNEEDSVIEAYLCKQALFLSFELSSELLHLNRDIEENQAKQAEEREQKSEPYSSYEDDMKKWREERAKRRAKRKSQAQAPATEPAQEEEIANPAQTQAQRSKADD